MSLCSGHGSNVARGGDKANIYSLPTGIHEDLVARPLNSPAKRDEKNLGVLGCKNPTVMITCTRSVCRGTPATGIINSGAIRRVEADAVQGVTLVPQPVDVGTSNKTIDAKEKIVLEIKLSTHVGKKENLFIWKKLKNSNPFLRLIYYKKTT